MLDLLLIGHDEVNDEEVEKYQNDYMIVHQPMKEEKKQKACINIMNYH